jgi:hypothetical protein
MIDLDLDDDFMLDDIRAARPVTVMSQRPVGAAAFTPSS